MPNLEIQVSRRAERDLRRMGPGTERNRIIRGLQGLARSEAGLDIRALVSAGPWLRLRIGDWRVLFRSTEDGVWVERIVHRRDLERAVETL